MRAHPLNYGVVVVFTLLMWSSISSAEKKKSGLAEYLDLEPSLNGMEVKNFDFRDIEIKDLVALIAKWTGKSFILDPKVQGRITILGPSQVTLQEAYQAFLSA